jgi:hypothetical protein
MTPAPAQAGLLTHRIVQVPAVPPDQTPRYVSMRSRILPTLAMSHADGQPVVCCWLRTTPHGRVAVLVGGVGQVSARGALPFPAGAKAKPLRRDQADGAIGRLACWKAAHVAVDLLQQNDSPSLTGPSLDDLFALLPDRSMAVLTAAVPVRRSDIAGRLDELSDTINELEPRRTGRGAERVRLARAEQELRYLEHAAAYGLWRLRIWTGGGSDEDCDAVAALVGASADLTGVPLRVRPGNSGGRADNGLRWSAECVVGADAVATLARPPTVELPGIMVTELPRFDLTPERAAELPIGSVLDASGEPALPFGLNADSVNRHVLVTGATGAGKSETVRSLLTQLTGARIPWLVIEPAKAEYARIAGRLRPADVLVVRPGQTDVVPGSLNPLEPSAVGVGGRSVRFPLQTHLDMVRALFTASFDAQEPFPQLLSAALTRCYERAGWNLALGEPLDGFGQPRWPTLSDLQEQALHAVDEVGYAAEIRQNMRGFVRVRIDSLRAGTPGRFFEGGHPLDLVALLERNVIFEIEDLGDDRDKAFFIGCVLLRVFEVLRLREQHSSGRRGLAHVTVVEEAHRLLRADVGGPAADAVTMFANLLAEIRAYGEGIVVAEQIPAKLVPDVVKNSAVKLMHRLPARDDRDFVGATMNLADDQSAHVVALRPGVAVAHTDGMDHPVLVAVDRGNHTLDDPGAATTTPPVLRRHAGCPDSCVAKPCTLRDIVRADHLPDQAGITLWAEIAVLAHLVGQPVGTVEPGLRARLRDSRALCAIGTAVNAAVERRHRHIRRWYVPADLTRHVATLLYGHVHGGADIGEQDSRWRIAQFRWGEVYRALRADDETDPNRPHPDTATWADAGLVVTGTTQAEQYHSVLAQAQRDQAPVAPALGGEPMVIDHVTAELAVGAPAERLTAALGQLGLRSDWPAIWLRTCWEDNDGT